MTNEQIAKAIKEAFEEGWSSYTSPCNPYTLLLEEWRTSEAKVLHDRLISGVYD